MRAMAITNNLTKTESASLENNFQKRQKRWTAALLSGSILGIISGFSGLIVSCLNAFGVFSKSENAANLGTLLIVAAFPLLIFSAHCLDKIEETDKRIRIERCQANGLKDRK